MTWAEPPPACVQTVWSVGTRRGRSSRTGRNRDTLRLLGASSTISGFWDRWLSPVFLEPQIVEPHPGSVIEPSSSGLVDGHACWPLMPLTRLVAADGPGTLPGAAPGAPVAGCFLLICCSTACRAGRPSSVAKPRRTASARSPAPKPRWRETYCCDWRPSRADFHA